jgi:AcrR family transcriptional regulator
MSPTLRKSAQVRRAEIAEAAIRLAGDRGAPSLTAAAIAAEVGLTSGALFRHFDSIDAILEAAAERAIEWVEATFPAPDLPARERLESLVRARVVLLGEHPGLVWFLLSDQAAARIPVAARERLADLAKATRAQLTSAITEARAAGELRNDVAPEAQLTILIGAVHALARRGQATEDPSPILAGIFQLLRPTNLSQSS